MEKQGEITALANEIINLNRSDIDKMLYDNEVKLSHENIQDIEREGHYYILIKYPAPLNELKMIENFTGQKAEKLFEDLKESTGLVSDKKILTMLDKPQEKEVVDAGEKLGSEAIKDKNESKLFNLRLLFDDLDTLEKEFLNNDERRKKLSATLEFIAMQVTPMNPSIWKGKSKELLSNYGKDVVLAPDEDIIMICKIQTSEVEEIKTIIFENGVYKINSEHKTMDANNSDVEIDVDEKQSQEKENEQATLEFSNGNVKKLVPKKNKPDTPAA